ncbi:hypothetical protein, partial [Xanthomonas graminis]
TRSDFSRDERSGRPVESSAVLGRCPQPRLGADAVVCPPGPPAVPARSHKRLAGSGLPAAARRRCLPVHHCLGDNGLVARTARVAALCMARSQGFRHYAEFRVAIC